MSCCALMLLVAGPAAAQTSPPKFTQKVADHRHEGLQGHVAPSSASPPGNRRRRGWHVKGKLRGRSVRKENVRIPLSIVNDPAQGQTKQVPPTPGALPILERWC